MRRRHLLSRRYISKTNIGEVLREAHPHQLIARLCLGGLGLLALWGWYSIKS
jgi:hypothetical protein